MSPNHIDEWVCRTLPWDLIPLAKLIRGFSNLVQGSLFFSWNACVSTSFWIQSNLSEQIPVDFFHAWLFTLSWTKYRESSLLSKAYRHIRFFSCGVMIPALMSVGPGSWFTLETSYECVIVIVSWEHDECYYWACMVTRRDKYMWNMIHECCGSWRTGLNMVLIVRWSGTDRVHHRLRNFLRSVFFFFEYASQILWFVAVFFFWVKEALHRKVLCQRYVEITLRERDLHEYNSSVHHDTCDTLFTLHDWH